MDKDAASEIGRELKVSELKPRTIVWLAKEGRNVMATMWVIGIGDLYVHFRAGAARMDLVLERRGPGLEQLADDSNATIKLFEYLGEP